MEAIASRPSAFDGRPRTRFHTGVAESQLLRRCPFDQASGAPLAEAAAWIGASRLEAAARGRSARRNEAFRAGARHRSARRDQGAGARWRIARIGCGPGEGLAPSDGLQAVGFPEARPRGKSQSIPTGAASGSVFRRANDRLAAFARAAPTAPRQIASALTPLGRGRKRASAALADLGGAWRSPAQWRSARRPGRRALEGGERSSPERLSGGIRRHTRDAAARPRG